MKSHNDHPSRVVLAADLPDEPPPGERYRHRVSPIGAIRELWRDRQLIRSLAERQLRARYKQAILGFLWAIITPLALMVAFALVFDRIGNVETKGAPYTLFSYLGLLPWTFYTSSLQSGANSIIANITLINKIFCPREVFPLAGVVVALIDTILSLLALALLFGVTGFVPRSASVWVPVVIPVLLAFTIGWSFIIAVVVVYVRDLRWGLPLLIQIGLFVTPVAYGFEVVPARWQNLYCVLNPLGPVIDSFRRAVLFDMAPDFSQLGLGALGAFICLFVGYWMFKRMEAGIADVA